MKFLVLVSTFCAVTCAKSGLVDPVAPPDYPAVAPANSFAYSPVVHRGVAPVYYNSAPVAHYSPSPYATSFDSNVAQVVKNIQYNARGRFGQASYGHDEAYQSSNAFQDFSGNKDVEYIVPNGELIRIDVFRGDSLGFPVIFTDFSVNHAARSVVPVGNPEVTATTDAHLKDFEEVKTRSRRAAVVTPYLASSYAANPYQATRQWASPLIYSNFATPDFRTNSIASNHQGLPTIN